LHEPLLGWSILGMGAVALRYAKGEDLPARLKALLGGEVTEVTANKTYLRSKKYRFLDQADLEVAGSVADDGSVLISVWPVLEFMLGIPWDDKRFEGDLDRRLARGVAFTNLEPPTGKTSPLGSALNGVDLDHDLVLVLTPQPVLEKLAKLKDWEDPPEGLPAAYLPAWHALKRLTAAVVTVDFGAKVFLRVELRAADEGGAKALLSGLEALLPKAKDSYPDMRKELLRDLAPEVRTPILAVVGELVTHAKLSRAGNVVVLTTGKPKGLVHKE
jgi:hypothetical protein